MRPFRCLGPAVVAALALSAPASAYQVHDLHAVSSPAPSLTCPSDLPGTPYDGSEVEPQLAVAPDGTLAGSWQQNRFPDGGSQTLSTSFSDDGGATWDAPAAVKWTSFCTGGTVANGGDFERATDPWLDYGPTGDLFHVTQVLDITKDVSAVNGEGKNGMTITRFPAGAGGWLDPQPIHRDELPRYLNDKVSLTADPTDARYVYVAWDRLEFPNGYTKGNRDFIIGYHGPVLVSRTTDGGNTWIPAKVAYDPGGTNQTLGTQIGVLADGTVLNVFAEFTRFKNNDHGSQFDINLSNVRSRDHGAHWSKVQRISKVTSTTTRTPESGDEVRDGDVIPDLAVNRDRGANGYVYVVWQQSFGTGHNHVALSISRDGGNTWTAPARIDQAPDDVDAFIPSVAVADDGTVGVTYYDFRDDTAGDGSSDAAYRFTSCKNSCTDPASWTELAAPITTTDYESAPYANGRFLGDYMGLEASGDSFKTLFGIATGTPGDPLTDIAFASVDPS